MSTHTAPFDVDLARLQERIKDWRRTKLPGVTLDGISQKIVEEAHELSDAPQDMSEAADVLIALINHVSFRGIPVEDLVFAAHLKMDLNERRAWHPPDANGVHKHVKEPSHA